MIEILGLIHRRPFAGSLGYRDGLRSLRAQYIGSRVLKVWFVLFQWLVVGAVLLVSSATAQAASSVTIGWDAINNPVVTGYRIHYGLVGAAYTGVVDVGSATTGRVTGLIEGVTYRFAVASYNGVGMESVLSSEVQFTPRLAPTIQVAQPIAGSVFATASSVTLAAEVVPNGNAIANVEFLIDGVVVGGDSVAPYAWTWAFTTEGSHTIASRVIYNGTNVVGSGVSQISVVGLPTGGTAQPPVVTLTSPVDGSVRSTPLPIGMAASVQANGHIISRVQFYSGLRLIGEDTTAPYTCTWIGVNAGTYSVAARAIYDADLVQSSAVSTVVVQDPPAIEISAPVSGSVVHSPATLGLAATVTPNGHVITKVRFYNGPTLLGEDTTAPFGWQWVGVSEGSYSITARVYYDSGSTLLSAPVVVNAITAAPTIRIDAPLAGVTYPNASDILIRGVVAANGHVPTKVQFLRDGELVSESTGPEYQWLWASALAGQYTWVARLVYDSGQSVDSAPVSVMIQRTPPSIQLSSPLNESSYQIGSTLNVQAGVQANGNSLTKVEFLVDGVVIGESLGPVYSTNWTGLSAKTYTLGARLTYGTGSVVSSGSVLVALTNPPPTIRLDSPLVGSVYPGGQVIPLRARVTLNGNSPSKVQFMANGQLVGETTGPSNVLDWAGAQPGTYSMVARLYFNGLRWVDSPPISISIIQNPPTFALDPGLDGAAFPETSAIPLGVLIQANANLVNSVEYWVDNGRVATVTTSPYAWMWTNASIGAHWVTARLNYSGGASVLSAPASVWVGELPPPWLSKDLQTDVLPGASSLSNQVFRISGAGVVNGTRDSARFVSQALSGDGEISACVVSTLSTGRAGSVGVMMRETLLEESRHVFMGIAATGEWRWQRRDETAGLTWTGNYSVSSLPRAWVRLVRVGNLFSGYSSPDGINWTLQNTRTLAMPTTIYFGLAVSSGASITLNTAEFSSVVAEP